MCCVISHSIVWGASDLVSLLFFGRESAKTTIIQDGPKKVELVVLLVVVIGERASLVQDDEVWQRDTEYVMLITVRGGQCGGVE